MKVRKVSGDRNDRKIIRLTRGLSVVLDLGLSLCSSFQYRGLSLGLSRSLTLGLSHGLNFSLSAGLSF